MGDPSCNLLWTSTDTPSQNMPRRLHAHPVGCVSQQLPEPDSAQIQLTQFAFTSFTWQRPGAKATSGAKSVLHLSGWRSSLREAKAGWSAGQKPRHSSPPCSPGPCAVTCLTPPRTICPGMAPPTVDWAPPTSVSKGENVPQTWP